MKTGSDIPCKTLRKFQRYGLARRNKERQKGKKEKKMEFLVVNNDGKVGSFMTDQKLNCRPIILSERTMEKDS